MEPKIQILLDRARNELKLSNALILLSNNSNLQEKLEINKFETFYSAAISHSYYSIFYSAKAYLQKKNIYTSAPEEHKNTFEKFKELADLGEIDMELFRIYEALIIRADYLLGIFKIEKKKRGTFTYKKLPQANLKPAEDSKNNAEVFFKHMYQLCHL